MNHLKIILFYIGFVFFSRQVFSQNSSLGASFSTYYNFKTVHYSPGAIVQFGNHALYAGPDFVSVLQPLGDPINAYEEKATGLQFGYDYTFFIRNRLSVLFDLHFSMYNYQTITYTWFTMTHSNRLIIENSLAFAANYQLTKGLSVYSGAGLNSYDGFFCYLNIAPQRVLWE
ncbi:MAG: hypothetical protein QE487_17950 [Fluviicola sp.]|nr:hypothetical protein [Fluviicola sp.]